LSDAHKERKKKKKKKKKKKQSIVVSIIIISSNLVSTRGLSNGITNTQYTTGILRSGEWKNVEAYTLTVI
tara:strand:+ start:257 stop:466 length:210 start_codon:yes stop_codon:yes gene_type:complete